MFRKLLLGVLLLVLCSLLNLDSKAQMTVNSSVTATQLAQALVGTGVQVSNAVLNCGTGGFGLFNVTGGNLGMQSGILLTNGSAVNAIGPNNLPSISTNFTPALPGDPDLNAILFPTPTADACSLEFDVFVSSDTLSFNYIFGSDEYPEFVSFWPVINDLFGLFISGPGIVGKQNIALVPNTATYVGINTVNCTVNGVHYVCNTPAGTGFGGVCATGCPTSFAGTVTEYDGFTKKLVAKKAVQKCNTYHLKIVIADGNDDVVDSGLFLEAASLSTSGVNVIASVDSTGTGGQYYPNMVEGCKNGNYCFIRAGLNTDTSVIKFQILGSAVNGVDYNHIADSLVFYPGDSMLCVPIIPQSDGLNEGLESVIIRVIYTSCSGSSYLGDSLILYLQDPLKLQLPADTIICTNPFIVTAQSSGTLPAPTLNCGSNGTVTSAAPIIHTVGTGTNNASNPSFLNGYYHDSRVLMVFSKNDLTNAGANSGIIQNIAFNVTQYNSSYPYQNFSVKIGCANSANPSLPSGFVGGLNSVYGPVNFTPSLGWNTINFAQGFDWDGKNGLYIEICYDDTIGSNSDVIQKSLTTTPSVLYAYKDSTIGCSMNFAAPNTIGSSSLRPNIRFGIAAPNPTPFNYSWSPVSIISSGLNTNSVTVNLTQPTLLTCALNNIPGCVVRDTMLLNYVNAAALNVSNDTTVCPNSNFNLSAAGGLSYNWYSLNGNSLSCVNCSNPAASIVNGGITDSFVVVASMQGGCILRDTVKVRSINAPIASFTLNTPVCLNTPTQVTFNGSAAASANFMWNFNAGSTVNLGTNNIGPYTVSWSSTGMHSVSLQISDSGCLSNITSLNAVVLNALPINVFVSNDTICQNDIIQVQEFNNLSNANYNWNFNSGNILNGSGAGPYNIQFIHSDSIKLQISSNGCNSPIVTKNVFVKPLPNPSFYLSDTLLCAKQIDTLFFNGGGLNPVGGPLFFNWDFGTSIVTPIQLNSSYSVYWNNTTMQSIVDTISLVLTQAGCASNVFEVPVSVKPNPIPVLQLTNDSICENGSTSINALNSLINNSGGPVSYNWINSGITLTPGGNTAGPYTITTNTNYDSISNVLIVLSVTQDACTSLVNDSNTLVIIPQPVASFTVSKNPICSGVPVMLNFNGSINNFNGGAVSYNWNFNGGIANPGNGAGPQSVIYNNSDTFFQSYIPSLTLSQNGCISTVYEDTLKLYPLKKFDILATPNFCIGQTGYLYPSQNFASYQWSTGSKNDSLFVQISGHYVLHVTDVNGCIDSNYYNLSIKPAPHANAGVDLSIYSGNYIQIDGSSSFGGNTFSWSPTSSLSLSNVSNPYAAPTITTYYVLSYTDTTNGCVDRDTMIIFVKECSELIIPNAFTPNQDGVDDYFMIMNPDAIYKLSEFVIFNRWGQKVYETSDKLSTGWDGKLHGKEQEIGTYMYLIIAECGGGKQFKRQGNITLIR